MGNFQEASDLENTVGISARRFDESPFTELARLSNHRDPRLNARPNLAPTP